MIAEGTPAPPFSLPDHRGMVRSLTDFAGRWLVLWWYPRACSEVCSVQARALAPSAPVLHDLGAAIVGISFDGPAANASFADQEHLDFPLLSDENREVGTAYDVVRNPDDLFPDTPRRVTYVIDPAGIVRRSYLVTDAAGHADRLLADLRELVAETGPVTS